MEFEKLIWKLWPPTRCSKPKLTWLCSACRCPARAQQLGLREELDGAVAGAVDPELRPAEHAVAQLQADLRAVVEAEEIGEQVAEAALAQGPREAMGHAEPELVPRQPERGG